MYEHYKKATLMMGTPSLGALRDEVGELISDRSAEELCDVIHTLARLARLPSGVVWVIAHSTAKKHAERVALRGCPRSERSCREADEACCCRVG
jgi:hypothetical protein